MTATQFITQFLDGIQSLYMNGVINSTQFSGILDTVLPVLEDALSVAIFDEDDYYHELDIEYDFHALDDAKFEAIEESYDTSEGV